jgi:LPXTG-site transpeptidase (sortase) family protein
VIWLQFAGINVADQTWSCDSKKSTKAWLQWSFPSTFSSLTNLQVFNISYNTGVASSLSGTIMPSTLTDYCAWSMDLIDLAPNQFSWLSNLQVLSIHHNQISTLATGLFLWLSNLEVLDISDNDINLVDTALLWWLDSLQQLYFDTLMVWWWWYYGVIPSNYNGMDTTAMNTNTGYLYVRSQGVFFDGVQSLKVNKICGQKPQWIQDAWDEYFSGHTNNTDLDILDWFGGSIAVDLCPVSASCNTAMDCTSAICTDSICQPPVIPTTTTGRATGLMISKFWPSTGMVSSSIGYSIQVKNGSLYDISTIIISELLPPNFVVTGASLISYNTGSNIWNIDILPSWWDTWLDLYGYFTATGSYTNTAVISWCLSDCTGSVDTIIVDQTINGVCGTANTNYAYVATGFGSDTFCSTWTLSWSSPSFPSAGSSVTRQCLWTGGWTDVSCTATHLWTTTATGWATGMTISKTWPSTGTVGSGIVYQIHIINSSVYDINNIAIIESLPSGLIITGWTSTTWSYSTATNLWTIASMPMWWSGDLFLYGYFTATGSYTNTAIISWCMSNCTGSVVTSIQDANAIAWVCGTANTNYAYVATGFGIDTFCSTWTLSWSSPSFPSAGSSVTRQCLWTGGGSTASCTATHIWSTTTTGRATGLNINKTWPSTGTISSGIMYTITLSNASIYDINSIAIVESLPSTFVMTGWTSTTWSYSTATNFWTLPSLVSSWSSSLTLYGYFTATGSYTNTAVISWCMSNCTGSVVTSIQDTGAVAWVCGTANTNYAYSATGFGSDTFCSTWTLSWSSPAFPSAGSSVTRQCLWTGGGSTASCTATHLTNSSYSSYAGAYNPVCYPTVDDANCDGVSDHPNTSVSTFPHFFENPFTSSISTSANIIPIQTVQSIISHTTIYSDAPIRAYQKEKYKYRKLKTIWYQLPQKLYPTGTPRDLLAQYGIKPESDIKIEQEMPAWMKPHNQKTAPTYLQYRLDTMPSHIARDAHAYIVIPRFGVVAPANEIVQTYDEANYDLVKRGAIPQALHEKYFAYGVLRMPDSPGGWAIGNNVFFGHSNNLKSKKWDFNTVFATLPAMKLWDKVYLYEKNASKWYSVYEYRAISANQVKADEVSVLSSKPWANMTLITCSLWDFATKRRVVRLKLKNEIQHYQKYIKLSHRIDDDKKITIKNYINDIDNSDLTQAQKNKKLTELRYRTEQNQKENPSTENIELTKYVKNEIAIVYNGWRKR